MGHDLTELILQYLTFEDKVRLECVSKQWRRLVFNKQFAIELNYYIHNPKIGSKQLYRRNDGLNVDIKALESVVKKCSNIETVHIHSNLNAQPVLSLIGQYCPNIKSLTCNGINNILDFIRDNGHKLEDINLYNISIEKAKHLLRFCSNLIRITIYDFPSFIEDFLPKLKHIDTVISIDLSDQNPNKIKPMIDNYSQSVKKLKVCFQSNLSATQTDLNDCLNSISLLENLQSLHLLFHYLPNRGQFVNNLKLIGQKCTKLSELEIRENVEISYPFFSIFSEFKNIKKLMISLPESTVLSGSVESFKHCKQLIDIEICYPELTEDFFTVIASSLPKVKRLVISTKQQFFDLFIDLFRPIKSIEYVYLHINNSTNRMTQTKKLFFGQSIPDEVLNPNRNDVKRVNDNCLLVFKDYIWPKMQ